MNRRELEHVIRAAGDVADDDELIIIGSQAILGQAPHAAKSLVRSMEVDLYPKNKPERWDLLDGTLGEGSPFHATFGYYVQGVGESTATLPAGWKQRLVPVRNPNTRGVTGWCLESHDLVISKCVASRPKDLEFLRDALAQAIVRAEVLLDRLEATALSETLRQVIRERILAAAAAG